MKKIRYIALSLSFVFAVFSFGISSPIASADTVSSMTISQFVELMISLGVVPNERVAAARAMITTLSAIPTTAATTLIATSSLPYIQVLSPNGAESWGMDVDVAYNITWGSTGAVPVTVSLVPSKGTACDLTASPVSSRNGNNSLAVKLKTASCYNQITGSSTALKDGTYKVRVAYNMGTTTLAKDESDAVFKITPVPVPSLKVTYPNGGENLTRNKEYTLKYTTKNVQAGGNGLIYMYLLDSNGEIAFNSHKLFRTDGTYDLELPSSLTPGAYRVKLKMTTNEKVELEDQSDNLFWISSAN